MKMLSLVFKLVRISSAILSSISYREVGPTKGCNLLKE